MRKMNVLIVDDEEPVLMLLERILGHDPTFHITTTTRGYEALTLMKLKKYDAMICDMALPDLTGDEVIREVHRRVKDPPFIIVMSGIIKHMSGDESRDLVFMKKPFSPDEVLALLRRAWRKKLRKERPLVD